MNLAQSNIPKPQAPINVLLPDLKRWEHHSDAERIAEKKQLIAETLEEVKEVLKAHQKLTIAEIREFLPESSAALPDWMYVWMQQGHVQRRRIGSTYFYSLGKGSE